MRQPYTTGGPSSRTSASTSILPKNIYALTKIIKKKKKKTGHGFIIYNQEEVLKAKLLIFYLFQSYIIRMINQFVSSNG